MKQGKIIAAIKALDRVGHEKMPLALSSKIYRLRKKLQPHWDWQTEKELDIIKECGMVDETGRVSFTKEGREAFEAALAEISGTEIDHDWETVDVPEDADINITPAEIEALEGFLVIIRTEGDEE